MKLKIKIITLLTMLSLVLAFNFGCKTSEDAAPTGTNPNPNSNTVTIRDSSFSPGTITVPVGTTVTWEQSGNVVHTVTSGTRGNADGMFNSGDMNNGDTFQFTFNNAGTFNYHCVYHVGMDGTVIVQ